MFDSYINLWQGCEVSRSEKTGEKKRKKEVKIRVVVSLLSQVHLDWISDPP